MEQVRKKRIRKKRKEKQLKNLCRLHNRHVSDTVMLSHGSHALFQRDHLDEKHRKKSGITVSNERSPIQCRVK